MGLDDSCVPHRKDAIEVILRTTRAVAHRCSLFDQWLSLRSSTGDQISSEVEPSAEESEERMSSLMAQYGNFMDCVRSAEVPVAEGLMLSVQNFREALQIDAQAEIVTGAM